MGESRPAEKPRRTTEASRLCAMALPWQVRVAVLGWLVSAAHAAPIGDRALPAPARLMVEGLLPPARPGELLLVSTTHPRFSFTPHAQHEHPGRGVAMAAYRIVVTPALDVGVTSAPAPAWDSGVVNASGAVGVRCQAALQTLLSYTWEAQWWAANGTGPSPSSVGTFHVGPVVEGDWHGAPWVGANQSEFRFRLPAVAAPLRGSEPPFTLYVAAPGGSVIRANGQAVSDLAGVSPWINFETNIPYSGWVLPAGETATDVTVEIGSGFFSRSWWRRTPMTYEYPVGRLLVVNSSGVPIHVDVLGGCRGWRSGDHASRQDRLHPPESIRSHSSATRRFSLA